jgi:hypothetical protein
VEEDQKDNQLDLIYGMIRQHSSGITISSLEEALNRVLKTPMNRRTLLRRLLVMKNSNLILTRGSGNNIYYFISETPPSSEFGHYYQWSQEAERMRAYIHQPIFKRKPVQYNPNFIDSYIPGETFYLPLSLRRQLESMGKSHFYPQPGQEKVGGTYIRTIYHKLLVDLSWASSRLEGNTYTRLETQNLIELGQVATGKDLIETQMILNHKSAIETMVENADRINIDAFTLFTLHANLSYNLLPNAVDSGRLRQGPVEISGTTYIPMAIPDQIQCTFHKILEKASQIMDPYELSFFMIVHLPYLQPFIDVNKRVSRLVSNIPFIRSNLCPLSFIGVDEKSYIDGLLALYEMNDVTILREVYTWAYERSCQQYAGIVQTMAEPNPLRLRYKDVIFSVIKRVIEHLEKPTAEVVERILNEHTHQPHDHQALHEMILEEMTFLHEGNIGRYGLTPLQYYKWKSEG